MFLPAHQSLVWLFLIDFGKFNEPDFIITEPDFYVRHIASEGLVIPLKKVIWYTDTFIY